MSTSRLDDLVSHWVRPEIRARAAYQVPSARGMVKLDAMENPYTWPEPMIEEWLAAIRGVPLNRYPDPSASALKERLRVAMGVPDEAEILLGNGSDELIQMVAMALCAPGRVLLAPEPTFVMYRLIAECVGMRYVGVPLREADFGLDGSAMLDAIERHCPAVVFLAWPNNPTGNLFEESLVADIFVAAPGLVVIDEAYAPFAGSSFLGRSAGVANLLVMRTLSKLGLAGLRLGMLTGFPDWIREIDKTRLPYNINVLTQASADFALARPEVFDSQTQRIREDRARVLAALGRLPGVVAYPSHANFILFRVPRGRGDATFADLYRFGVLVKNLNGTHSLLADCLRVTVGTEEENGAFLAALAKSLG